MSFREPAPPNPDFAETTKRFLMEMPIARYFGFAITGVNLKSPSLSAANSLSAKASSKPVP